MSSVTVLSGVERRRRWSATDKARIVEESIQPGAVVSAVAHRHDVHPNLLRSWRRQVKQQGGVRLLPVSLAAEKKRIGVPVGGSIEIELSSGVRLRVDTSVDEAALGRVLRALGQ
jgi:transposase